MKLFLTLPPQSLSSESEISLVCARKTKSRKETKSREYRSTWWELCDIDLPLWCTLTLTLHLECIYATKKKAL